MSDPVADSFWESFGAKRWLLAVPPGIAIVQIELMKALRSSFWAGFNATEWIAIGLALVAFCLVIGIGAWLLEAFLRMVRVLPHPGPGTIAALHWVIAAAIWMLLTIAGQTAGARSNLALCSILIAAGIAAATLARVRRLGPTATALIATISVAAGIVTTLACGLSLTFEIVKRAELILILPPLAIAATGAVLVLVVSLVRDAARRVAGVVLVTALFLGLPIVALPRLVTGAPSEGSEKLNLLLITSDALRADYCSTYGGHVPTPALDRLRNEGVRFPNSYSLAPWTVPAMYGMFSSSYPASLTIGADRETWRRDITLYRFSTKEPTLAERLEATGYYTAAFVGNPVLDDPDGLLRGMQHSIVYPAHTPVYRGPLLGLPTLREALRNVAPDLVPLRQADTVRIQTEQALAFLDRHRQAPFFLWVHFIDPHTPYDPPDEYRTMDGPWSLFSPQAPYWPSPQLQDDGSIEVAEEDVPYVRHLYEGEIQYMDRHVDGILNALDGIGLADNTIVCFSADHGEEFWDHGRYGHGQSVYNELIRVPLLFRGPGIGAGVDVEAPVSGLDLMPTFAELLGIKSTGWRGTSLVADMKGSPSPRPPVFSRGTNRYAWPDTFEAVVRGNYKLIQNSRTESYLLFDLLTDTGETVDISGENPEIASELLRALAEWRTALSSSVADQAPPDAGPDENMEELLRSIGYIE
ncbi:MAG: hypothetical protein AMXMBFR82_43880 [Candidatus Hydrogenedentota bacterium]